MENNQEKKIRFGTLMVRSLPEIWTYQLFAIIILAIVAAVLNSFISLTANSTGHALSTGNIRELFLTWRTPVILLLGFLLVFAYVLFEILVQVCMCDDILSGRPVKLWPNLKKTLASFKDFLNPSGIGILLFVLIAVPLCGLGFSVSLSRSFYIPNFIFDRIRENPLFLTGYIVLIAFLIFTAYRWIFSFHGILISGLKPKEAKKRSKELLKGHHARFIIGMAITVGVVFLIQSLFSFFAGNVLEARIENIYSGIPKGIIFPVNEMGLSELTGVAALDQRIVEYRVISCVYVFLFTFISAFLSMLGNSYVLLRLTRYYHAYSGKDEKKWPARPAEVRNGWRILIIIVAFFVIVGAGVLSGFFFDSIFTYRGYVEIVAHRAGGDLASENSLEGLEEAIAHSCYGSEIDIQRTKDGYYIVNHDDTFRRIAGVNKRPADMTLAEIRELEVKDTSGNGRTVRIPTIEEMLDVIKDREKLFIELKGATADQQMVDDVVRIVRERDAVDDVVLISLKYDVIDYAETNYPEFETGVLIFAGIGNVAKMNTDIPIMEEEMASDGVIDRIHNAGKKAMVWTVNDEASLRKFLDSQADGIITDNIERAFRVRDALDTRTDLQIVQDWMGRFSS